MCALSSWICTCRTRVVVAEVERLCERWGVVGYIAQLTIVGWLHCVEIYTVRSIEEDVREDDLQAAVTSESGPVGDDGGEAGILISTSIE